MLANGPKGSNATDPIITAIGVTNLDHFVSFVSQGGFPERYYEWLKARFDFDEGQAARIPGRNKGKERIVQRIATIDQETSSSEAGSTTSNAENS
jgi:hypothetical protein